jgi:hypothetical protein
MTTDALFHSFQDFECNFLRFAFEIEVQEIIFFGLIFGIGYQNF